MFNDEIMVAARLHAIQQFPNESCGLVVNDVYVPCQNMSDTPQTDFRISPEEYLGHGDVQAVIHSHPNGPDCPSKEDMQQQAATAVPWCIIISSSQGTMGEFWFGGQAPGGPLIGRPFRHGVTDCYSLVKDWYRQERSVTLPDFPRGDDWWKNGEDMYRMYFETAGFHKVSESEIQPGDVFVATIRSKVPNHAGVYLGNGLAIHHLARQISRREPVAPWMKYITMWLRYGP